MLAKMMKQPASLSSFLRLKQRESSIRKGMELGADDYLTKPFDDMELLNAIESRLRKKALLKKELAKGMEGYNQLIGELKKIEKLSDLFTQQKTRTYKKKQTIYMDGDYAMGLYVVNKGRVKTYIMNEDGKEFITAIHGENEYFGYIALLQDTAQKEDVPSHGRNRGEHYIKG
jgi:CRP-like cAMP-binding protein